MDPIIYLNNAGTTWPKPPAVIRAVTGGLENAPSELQEDLDRATADVARFLGLPDSAGMLWTSGCTAALAAALANLPWAPGDRVVTSEVEHQALDGPVQRLVQDRGVAHAVVPYRAGNPFDLDALRTELRAGGVRLVACASASNVTGELLPAGEIVELAHEYGALCLLDAAQTAGVVPSPVAAAGADLFAIAGHKGPLGPQGVGLLWAAASVRFACAAAVCEIGGGANRPGYCEVGGINLAGVLGLAEGTRWVSRHPDAFERARELARQLAEELRERPDCTVYGGDGPRTAAVSFRSSRCSPEQLQSDLAARGFVVRAGQHCAPRAIQALGAGAGTVRVSFGPFNTVDDLHALLRAVDALGGG